MSSRRSFKSPRVIRVIGTLNSIIKSTSLFEVYNPLANEPKSTTFFIANSARKIYNDKNFQEVLNMIATIILGIIVALAFGYGIRKIYVGFFKAEPACCNGGANCHCCSGCGDNARINHEHIN